MDCECSECVEYGGPNPKMMALKFIVMAVQLVFGLTTLIRERSWKALGAFFAGFTLFWTVARYLTCTRCKDYGQMCRSYYLGKATSLYLPKVEGKNVGPLGMVLELTALMLTFQSPALGIRDRRKRVIYMLLTTATFLMHYLHSCRHCATYATDWKRNCPAARTYRRLFGNRLFFGGGREVAL